MTERPIRRVLPCCPKCRSKRFAVLSCVGTNADTGPPELVVARQCLDCRARWETRRRRRDVCEHGTVLFVPCAGCARTWADIEGSKFHPEGENYKPGKS